MITHDRARELASAAHDGELDPHFRPELDAHLDECAACRFFADGAALLSEAFAAAPRLHAPPTLLARVRAGIRGRRRRWAWSLAPVLTAAAVLAGVLVVGGLDTGPSVFRVPSAGAAEPLAGVRTIYLEREITVRALAGSPAAAERTITTERMWFRAPGSLRVQRVTVDATGRHEQVVIERPGERYDSLGASEHGLPPSITLPEPVTPSIALYARDEGAGPAVAGRPTRRYSVRMDGEEREVLVDSRGLAILGGDVNVVVKKSTRGLEEVTKRVTQIRYDEPMADSLFEIPAGPRINRGFRVGDASSMRVRPSATPAGFARVLSGSGPDIEAVLYARGALSVLVTVTTSSPSDAGALQLRNVTVAGRPSLLVVPLYGTPFVRFSVGNRVVSVAAQLPADALLETASAMFPRG